MTQVTNPAVAPEAPNPQAPPEHVPRSPPPNHLTCKLDNYCHALRAFEYLTIANAISSDPSSVLFNPANSPTPTLNISFRRTIRVPDSIYAYSSVHDLPPDMGPFPLFPVAQYAHNMTSSMASKGGVFLPMYKHEAMWVNFTASMPFALKIYAGSVNAISGAKRGEDEEERIKAMKAKGGSLQDYVVVGPQGYPYNLWGTGASPEFGGAGHAYFGETRGHQRWLDGIVTDQGRVRQFVAVESGSGYSVEAQVTGEDKIAGIQFEVVPCTVEFQTEWKRKNEEIKERARVEKELSELRIEKMRQQREAELEMKRKERKDKIAKGKETLLSCSKGESEWEKGEDGLLKGEVFVVLGNGAYRVQVNAADTVESLMSKIRDSPNMPDAIGTDRQRLLYAERELKRNLSIHNDNVIDLGPAPASLESLGVKNESCIKLEVLQYRNGPTLVWDNEKEQLIKQDGQGLLSMGMGMGMGPPVHYQAAALPFMGSSRFCLSNYEGELHSADVPGKDSLMLAGQPPPYKGPVPRPLRERRFGSSSSYLMRQNTSYHSVPSRISNPGTMRSRISANSPAASYGFGAMGSTAPMPDAIPDALPQAVPVPRTNPIKELAIGAGGRISQSIQADPYPPSTWDIPATILFSVQLLSTEDFTSVTGLPAPDSPVSATEYKNSGGVFCDLGEEKSQVKGNFDGVKSVAQMNEAKGVPKTDEEIREENLRFGSVRLWGAVGEKGVVTTFRPLAEMEDAFEKMAVRHAVDTTAIEDEDDSMDYEERQSEDYTGVGG